MALVAVKKNDSLPHSSKVDSSQLTHTNSICVQKANCLHCVLNKSSNDVSVDSMLHHGH